MATGWKVHPHVRQLSSMQQLHCYLCKAHRLPNRDNISNDATDGFIMKVPLTRKLSLNQLLASMLLTPHIMLLEAVGRFTAWCLPLPFDVVLLVAVTFGNACKLPTVVCWSRRCCNSSSARWCSFTSNAFNFLQDRQRNC